MKNRKRHLTKTIGGKDPWGMPSDGGAFKNKPETRRWEKKQYHKAARREGRVNQNED